MQTGRQARPTLTLDKVPFQCPYMLFHATSNYKQGLGAQPFALHQNIKHCLLPKQKHFIPFPCIISVIYFMSYMSDTTAKSYKVTPMPDTCTCTAMTPPPYLPHCILYPFLTVNSVSDGVDSLLSGLHPPYSYMNSVSHGAGPLLS